MTVASFAKIPSSWKPGLMKSAINSLNAAGVFKLLQPNWQGVGAIFTLHHVADQDIPKAFSPNGILNITPEYLEDTILLAREMGYDIVSLDEVHRRLQERDFDKRFVAFTLDDGYHDNYANALPVFERHEVPFTVYVATSMPDGTAILWWDLLEQIIDDNEDIRLDIPGVDPVLPTRCVADKYKAFDQIYRAIRSMEEKDQSSAVADMLEAYAVDPTEHCKAVAMSWSTLADIAEHELCSIEAHTLTHPALSKLGEEEFRYEVAGSRELLESRLGCEINHFAYPFGDPGSAAAREFRWMESLGFKTSTTTRKGVLFPEHADHFHALPRISLNGDYQSRHYTRIFLEGGPFAFSNRFKRLNVA